jgi:hypothetical protein
MFSPGYESFATDVAEFSSSAQVMIICASVSTSKSGIADSPFGKTKNSRSQPETEISINDLLFREFQIQNDVTEDFLNSPSGAVSQERFPIPVRVGVPFQSEPGFDPE